MQRRKVLNRLLAITFGALLATGAQAAVADSAADYPSKPVRVIIPYPAGGSADTMARLIASKLSQKWDAAITVENRPGGGGNIGAEAVASAKPDGYTLLFSPPAPFVINQSLYSNKLSYDPTAFEPITLITMIPNSITVRPDLPIHNVNELIAYAREHPGELTHGSQGNGSTSHLTGEMFVDMTGTEILHVPYKGEGPALIDLIGGRVDLFFGNVSAVLGFAEDDKVRIIGVASAERAPSAPHIPTVAEQSDLTDFLSSAWFALAAPAGTPADIREKIQLATAEVLTLPEVEAALHDLGGVIVGSTPEELGQFMADERARWSRVIESAGAQID